MKTYKHTLEKGDNFKIPKYLKDKNICFLDIETTGFSRKYNQIYLIGLVYYDEDSKGWSLVQFFAENLNEEREVLERLNNEISKFDLIITYNGDSFDLPFINSKMKSYNINNKVKGVSSFDIYRELRKNESYLDLDNLRLKTIEESLGIYRSDEYSGKDCIHFYYEYVKTGNIQCKNNILKHNYEDLFYLVDVLKIFDVIREIKSFNIKLEQELANDEINIEEIDIEIMDIEIQEDILTIVCDTNPLNKEMDIIYYDENFNLRWQNKTSLIIDLNVKEGLITPTKKCIFINKYTLPINKDLKDLSKYMVPNQLVVLKVEKKLVMKNIKNIMEGLILYALK